MQIRKARGEIWFSAVATATLLLLLCSCGTRQGVYHRVKRGQTLYRIALTYKVSLDVVVEYNHIDDPFVIATGQKIFIPGADRELNVHVITPSKPGKGKIFLFPVRGRVTGKFGERRSRHRHKGIDIAAPRGIPVMAANSGKVIYTGSGFSGYGRMVLIDHQNGFITLYAHLKSISTRRGKGVRKGEIIGKVGTSGRATGPHLHFEVRYHEKLVDPLRYMVR